MIKEQLSYDINKGVNRSIEFRGLKGQYIYFLAIGLALLLVVFAVLYIAGVAVWLLVPAVLLLGGGLFVLVFRLSSKFGAHGLMKATARRQVPSALICKSRKPILNMGSGHKSKEK